MKTTKIQFRGYCMDFEIRVKRDEFLTMNEAQEHILNSVVYTGVVKKIVHCDREKGDEIIENKFFKNTTDIDVLRAKKLNKNENCT